MRSVSSATLGILATLLVAWIALVAFIVYGSEFEHTLNDGVFELSHQLLLVVVIGVAAFLLYRRFAAELAAARERRAVLGKMHAELFGAFNTAKEVRRKLRAHLGRSSEPGSTAKPKVATGEYEDQMYSLMGARLIFEIYKKRAADSRSWFSSGAELAVQLGRVESYLNSILDEHEESRKKFPSTRASKPITELPKLAEFIGPYRDCSAFKEEFKKPFRSALAALSSAGLT